MMAFLGVLVLLTCQAGNRGDAFLAVLDPPLSEVSSASDDPALALYKSGYSAILAKKWEESRRDFQLLLKKYPKSKYVDEASYWLAYSYASQDSKKAAEYYRQFLANYPDSPYFSDAVADLERLGYTRKESRPTGAVPSAGYDAAASQYEEQLRLKLEQERLLALHSATEDSAKGALLRERRRDPELEIKVAAIQALSRNDEDAQAFETLKSVAFDTTADWEVRIAAIQGLQRFKNRDVTSLLQSLLSGGDFRLRQQAIMALVRGGKIDAKTQMILVKFAEDVHELRDIRMTSLVALSEMRYQDLMTTLEKIVISDPDQRMRREALVLLDRAGKSDPARSLQVLSSVVSNPTEDRETREAAIYALAQFPDRQALDLLKRIVTSDSDKKLRLTALYAIGKYRSDSRGEVVSLLEEVALRGLEDRELRIAALFALADAKGDPPIDLYKDLALKEKDEEIRTVAVHLLAKSVKDKPAAFNTLSGIYSKSSSGDRRLREAALYGIAELGSTQSVAFLKNVARSDQDPDMRRQAVYFLGSIGGEEAKAALIEILKKQ
jgi:HEAT repeat protein